MSGPATRACVSECGEVDAGVSEAGVLAQEMDLRSRVRYLSFALLSTFLAAAYGMWVYWQTNSLVIQVDFLGSICDMIALLVNIATEVLKSRVRRRRTVLALDLAGCVLSLLLLLGITVYGMVVGVLRIQAGARKLARIQHEDAMLEYGSWVVFEASITLLCFLYFKDKLLPPPSQDGGRDVLNISSSVVHTLLKLASSTSVLITALWLRFGDFSNKSRAEMRIHETLIDVFGAFALCLVLLVSIGMLSKEMRHTLTELRELPRRMSEIAEDMQAEGLRAEEAGGGAQYGAMTSVKQQKTA